MLKHKNTLLKVPPIRPKPKESSLHPKLEENIVIKPSSGYERQIDYRFETQEEIETEEECKAHPCQENEQKKKNSFTNLNPKYNSIIIQEKTKRKLGFYHCDSLAIRPTCIQNQPTNKEEFSNKTSSNEGLDKNINLSTDYGTDKELNSKYNELVSRLKESRISKIEISNAKPRKYTPIFTSKLMKKSREKPLPKALTPFDEQIIFQKRVPHQGDFHITIECDEVTQCCF